MNPQRRGAVPLLAFLGLTSLIFVSILVFAYTVAKRANPVMLDDHGRPQQTQAR